MKTASHLTPSNNVEPSLLRPHRWRGTAGEWAYVALMAVITIVAYVLNALTTLKPDDILYSLIPGQEQLPCDTLWDYVRTIPYFYCDTDGRFGNILLRFISSLLDKDFFNVLNTIITVAFLHLMVLLATGRRSVAMLALASLFVLTLMPVPGETMLWMDGSCNYLWSITSTLAVLYFLINYKPRQHRWTTHVLAATAALVAGWMNESTTSGTLLGIMAYYYLNRKRFKGLAITVVVAYAVGVALDFGSPGFWHRFMTDSAVRGDISLMQMLTRRVVNTATKSAHFVTPAIAFVMIAVLVVRRRWRCLAENLVMWTMLGATLMIIALSITTSYRSYTAFAVLSFVMVAVPVMRWLEQRRTARRIITVGALVAAAPMTVVAVRDVYSYKQMDDAVIAAIESAPRQCVLPAAVWPKTSRFVMPVNYINVRPWPHKVFYCYRYDKDLIEFLPHDIYDRWRDTTFASGFVPAPFTLSDSIGTQAMRCDEAPYTLLPVDSLNVRPASQKCYVYYANMAQHLGEQESARRKIMGEFPERMPMTCYYLPHRGHDYIVLPELTDEVERVEMKLKIDGAERTVNLVRQHPNNPEP